MPLNHRTKRIGLIAGSGKFPELFAREAKKNGCEVIIIGFKGHTDESLITESGNFHWIKLGEFTKLINILKKESVTEAVLAGRIPQKVVLKDLSLDPLALRLYMRLKDKQPAAILSAIAEEVEKQGIKLLDSVKFLSSYLPEKGVLTTRKPLPEEIEDIEYGAGIAREIARLDIGQTVVVKNKAVLAVEAIEGTNDAIRRAAKFSRDGLVVIKVARPNQDMRFDIPVIGPKTVEVMKEAGASALAVESKKTLLIDRDQLLEFANASSISIIAV